MNFFLFLLSLSAVLVLATPHNVHLARRHSLPARADLHIRQANNKRCKNRLSSSDSLSPTPVVQVHRSTPSPSPTTPTTVLRSTPKPSPTPTPTNTNTDSSFYPGVHPGEGTFYATGLGACGRTNKDSDYIIAVSKLLYDVYPGYKGDNTNLNNICGKKIIATYGGKSVTVTVVDRCEGCAMFDLDFSPSAFAQLANFDVGRMKGMTWQWAT